MPTSTAIAISTATATLAASAVGLMTATERTLSPKAALFLLSPPVLRQVEQQ